MRTQKMERPAGNDGSGMPNGPAMRLMRLWLWATPLGMLATATLFGVLAVAEGKWGLVVAMVLLALVAVGLFVVQWRLFKRLRRTEGNDDGEV